MTEYRGEYVVTIHGVEKLTPALESALPGAVKDLILTLKDAYVVGATHAAVGNDGALTVWQEQ